ncbi:hypothetical protein [Methylocystis parvus]|uniref:hypothetical protein n=1 Tax=Methylocystis parvus TaxID=134 RepID=UPI003C7835E2
MAENSFNPNWSEEQKNAWAAEAARSYREKAKGGANNEEKTASTQDEHIVIEAPRPIRTAQKPRILVDAVNPDMTVEQLRDIFAESGEFFDRGAPVRIVHDKTQGGAVAVKMDADAIVLTAHKLARPYAIKAKEGDRVEVDARLPKSVASMYLSASGDWNLDVLNGIASAPLLAEDGSIRCASGYDRDSGFWLENVPDVATLVPARPTAQDAQAALRRIRISFRTFCFADAETTRSGATGLEIVDIGTAPFMDESTFLTALLTAVCRPSMPLAPGVLFTAAETSGAGTGKGKLARCISAIAFGRQPAAVTAGSGIEELEKRLSAKLIESAPSILVDNVNGAALKSDLLASAITERPAEIRILGRTEMAKLNASAFLTITGNGLRVSEDLARRFIEVRFDARTEAPETRPFRGDIVKEITDRRAELLADCLTIWRWGRQTELKAGRALGGFDAWARWCRDPLLALGCKDAVERVAEAKANDPRRQRTAEIFSAWWAAHRDGVVPVKDLDRSVLCVIDPQEKGRQFVARAVSSLAGTRLAGFVMSKQEAAGKWNAATYQLKNSGGQAAHRTHRTHPAGLEPMTPMSPMTDDQPKKTDAIIGEIEVEL